MCVIVGTLYTCVAVSGVMFTFATLGPSVGFILGGELLNVYVDIDTLGVNKYGTFIHGICPLLL